MPCVMAPSAISPANSSIRGPRAPMYTGMSGRACQPSLAPDAVKASPRTSAPHGIADPLASASDAGALGPAERLEDRSVAGAPAQVPGQGHADRLLVGLGITGQEPGRGHDHPRRAEAALAGVGVHEGLLD